MADFRIVEVLYPGMTQLDFTGPHTVMSRIPGAEVIVASEPGGTIRSDGGLWFARTRRMAEIDRCDLLFFPGGFGATEVINDPAFMAEAKRLAGTARYLTSVCTGSLILGALGVLKGRRAACHWAWRDMLKLFGAIPDAGRVVRDGDIITGGGVTAGNRLRFRHRRRAGRRDGGPAPAARHRVRARAPLQRRPPGNGPAGGPGRRGSADVQADAGAPRPGKGGGCAAVAGRRPQQPLPEGEGGAPSEAKGRVRGYGASGKLRCASTRSRAACNPRGCSPSPSHWPSAVPLPLPLGEVWDARLRPLSRRVQADVQHGGGVG